MKNVVDNFKIQKNAPLTKPIFLYAIQYDPVGNRWLRLTAWPTTVIFDGETYKPYVIRHGAIKETLSGKIEKLSLTIGNVDRELQYYLDNYNGLKEKTIVITMVFEDTLNDPTCYDSYTYLVEQSSSDKRTAVLALGSSLDVLNITLPRRKFFRAYCQFRYKGLECGYSGPEGTCNKTFTQCEAYGNVSRFGAYPAIPMRKDRIG